MLVSFIAKMNGKIMGYRGAVLAIGSLFWEETAARVSWRSENLEVDGMIRCKAPIRYGRKSEVSRKGTYSMVFSNELLRSQYGQAILLPLKATVPDYASFMKINKELAKAERIIQEEDPTKQSIITSWGTNCIIINPNLTVEKTATITLWWNKLFAADKDLHNSMNESRFSLRNYGLNADLLCIDSNGFLQMDFPGSIDFDFVLATATKVKLRPKSKQYPDAREIARAMVRGQYFKYFYNNVVSGIYTNEDRMIKKILRKEYSINRKEMSRLAEMDS